MLSSSSSTLMRSASEMIGRLGPFSRRMLSSVFTPTTSRSPCRLANWKYFTWPRWIRSKQPLVKTTRLPLARCRLQLGQQGVEAAAFALVQVCLGEQLRDDLGRRDRHYAELLHFQPAGDVG